MTRAIESWARKARVPALLSILQVWNICLSVPCVCVCVFVCVCVCVYLYVYVHVCI